MATSKIISSSEASRCILNQYFESRNFIQELLYGRDLGTLVSFFEISVHNVSKL